MRQKIKNLKYLTYATILLKCIGIASLTIMNKIHLPISKFKIASYHTEELAHIYDRNNEINKLISDPTRESILALACAFELEKDPGLKLKIINGIAIHKKFLSIDDLRSVYDKASKDEAFYVRMTSENLLEKTG